MPHDWSQFGKHNPPDPPDPGDDEFRRWVVRYVRWLNQLLWMDFEDTGDLKRLARIVHGAWWILGGASAILGLAYMLWRMLS